MRIPTATYRLQFHAQFGFTAAAQIAEYLDILGISDVYASPIFKARQGSTHGYDIVDPTQLNPELGSKEEFDRLISTLSDRGMGWLQDIVPNHMAYDGENEYLTNVLEYGENSEYFRVFDIEWDATEGLEDQVLVPLLGDFYDRCLERGEIQLKYDESGLKVQYYSLKLPVRIESYGRVMSRSIQRLSQRLGESDRTFIKLSGILYFVKSTLPEISGKAYREQAQFVKALLWELYQENADVRQAIDDELEAFNGTAGEPESFNALDDLLLEQFYRLAFWKVGAEELNYRRFFTVNELICVRVDEAEVFDEMHRLVGHLVESGQIDGVRVDHVDGLYDPRAYLQRLRHLVGDAYLVVEKILEQNEPLQESWPIQGTSGYDFLNFLNGIFCQQNNQDALTRQYRQLAEHSATYGELVAQKKRLIAETNLVGDINNLARFLKRICQQYRYGRDLTLYGLRTAIEEILIAFPIYCTYVDRSGISERDIGYVWEAIAQAREAIPQLVNELNLIEKFLLLEFEASLPDSERGEWLRFAMRLQQFTGPIMAKGVEDTLFYVYNRFISLNEVGGSPGHFGVSLKQFHQFLQQRGEQWPHTMNATSTHDTKRSEDVRARLNVLSEIPDEWSAQVRAWRDLNSAHKKVVRDRVVPDANDEYFLYQTLVGAFPFADEELSSFSDRVADYAVKAVREAKVHTAWLRPDSDYEDGFVGFARAVLDPSEDNVFLDKFRDFQRKIADYSIYNSLSQVLLKMTAPGVPDIYQGNELWDFSLVDPDNRRPVDYDLRGKLLEQVLNAGDRRCRELLDDRRDGRIKLWVTHRCLQARRTYAELFAHGDYQPLAVSGEAEESIIACARQWQGQTAVAIAPRFLTQRIQPGDYPIGEIWGDTTVKLPEGDARWHNWTSDRALLGTGEVQIRDVLAEFPVALLMRVDS